MELQSTLMTSLDLITFKVFIFNKTAFAGTRDQDVSIFLLLLLAALGLCCCMQTYSSCGEQKLLSSLFVVSGLLIAVASPVVEQRL